jgi:hypothetical protein
LFSELLPDISKRHLRVRFDDSRALFLAESHLRSERSWHFEVLVKLLWKSKIHRFEVPAVFGRVLIGEFRSVFLLLVGKSLVVVGVVAAVVMTDCDETRREKRLTWG